MKAGCFCPDYVSPIDILGNYIEGPSARSRFFNLRSQESGGMIKRIGL